MVAAPTPATSLANARSRSTTSDTALTLYRKLVPLGVALLTEMHPLIVQGRAPRTRRIFRAAATSGAGVPRRTNRLAMACATHLQSGARRDASLSGAFCSLGGRKLWVWESGIAHEAGRRAMRARSCRRPAEGAVESSGGRGQSLDHAERSSTGAR